MTGADLRAFLVEDVPLAALVAGRVHPVILPQGTTFPAITYAVITTQPFHTLQQPVTLTRIRVQIDVWAARYLDMEAVSLALAQRLNGFRGAVGGSPGSVVQGAFLQSERDLYESEPDLYRRSADYMVWAA